MHDQDELAAMELQIREFGQTPRQLFVLPHPPRLNISRVSELLEEEVRTVGSTTEGLSRMDSSSSNSWGAGHGPLTMLSSREEEEEEEWEHVVFPSGEEEEESKDAGE